MWTFLGTTQEVKSMTWQMLIWEFGWLGNVEWIFGDGSSGWNREWVPDILSPVVFRKIGFHVTDALFIVNFSLSEKIWFFCVSVNYLIVKEINGVELEALPLQSLLSGNYKWSRGRTAVRIPLGAKADVWNAGKNDTVPMTWQHVWLMVSHLFIAYRLRVLGSAGSVLFFLQAVAWQLQAEIRLWRNQHVNTGRLMANEL